MSSIDMNVEIVLFTSLPIIGNVGHSQFNDSKNSGPFTQGRIFLQFFGAMRRVPTSDGFRFVGQYLQLWINEDSRISAKRESTNTQKHRVLFRIKCRVAVESDQYITRPYFTLLSCNIEQATRVVREAATNSRRGIINNLLAGHTLHLPNKNCKDTVPSSYMNLPKYVTAFALQLASEKRAFPHFYMHCLVQRNAEN